MASGQRRSASAHRHGGMHAEAAHGVARGGDDAAAAGTADDQRLALELRTIPLLHRRVERVHVDVQNRPHSSHPIHGDRDFLRVQRRIEGHVLIVREQQLERVLARRQRQSGLGLALAEMHDLVGRRQRRIELQFAQVRVDQQMMVPRVVRLSAGGRDRHALQAEFHHHRVLHGRTVVRRDEIHLRAGGRAGARLRESSHCERRTCDT